MLTSYEESVNVGCGQGLELENVSRYVGQETRMLGAFHLSHLE